MKRTPLKRRKPLLRRAPKRLSRAGSDPAYLAWVRTLPCLMASTGRCDGNLPRVHAHHAIYRSQGGKDDVAVPLCASCHHHWHNHTGPFRGLSKFERWGWATGAIAYTQRLYERERAA